VPRWPRGAILDDQGFIDIETPFLYKSTPEGAREFLVPSRIHHGQFYALPQSPQLFKQMLMIAGFDRYYQIVKCFRDEDLRADRQPEFTQIDIETSFLTSSRSGDMMEGLVRSMWKEALGVELPDPFPVMTYADAMARYGSTSRTFACRSSSPSSPTSRRPSTSRSSHGRRLAERARRRLARSGRGAMSRKEIDDCAPVRRDLRRRRASRGSRSTTRPRPTRKGCSRRSSSSCPSPRCARSSCAPARRRRRDLLRRRQGEDRQRRARRAARQARARARIRSGDGSRSGSSTSRCSSTTKDKKTWGARHHPFTAPKDGHEERFATDPANAIAKAYDVVMNGWEIGGGSVRIHRPEVQQKVFAALGISSEDQQKKFGFLLDSLQYGAPPHGGIAFGLDRIAAMMAGVAQIRDVIAFPKTQRGQDLLVDTPTFVTEQQLRDLHIRVRPSDSVKVA
jgi:aspartyl-tRNA synthetase